MPVKRPLGLGKLEGPPAKAEDTSVKITDTMTLVVKDADGREVRIKDSGRQGGGATPTPLSDPGSTASQRPTPAKATESILDKIVFEDLKILEMLGAGSQGKVRKACHRQTGELYALKSIAFGEDKDATRDLLRAELKRLAAIQHPNIVTSYEAYFREGKLYIVLELMDCGTLTHLIKKCGKSPGVPERVISYIAERFLKGMAHLHASGVVHRDIKPGNLLLSSGGDVKIADFGVAKDFSNQQAAETLAAVGSTPYMSPERVKGERYSFLCDIWSMGLSIAETAIGDYPFENLKNNTFLLCQAIASGNAQVGWHMAAPRQFSPELQDFVAQCLLPVERRPSAEQLLKHPFLELGRKLAPAAAGIWFHDPLGRTIEEVEQGLARGELHPMNPKQPRTSASPNYTSASPMAMSSDGSRSPVSASTSERGPNSTTHG